MSEVNCPLCGLAKGNIMTKLYYQDDKVIIVDCETCGSVPMLVLKKHGEVPSPGERAELLRLCEKVFNRKVMFRGFMRRYPSHWHEHLVLE